MHRILVHVRFNRNQARIICVEGTLSDYLSTTTAALQSVYCVTKDLFKTSLPKHFLSQTAASNSKKS